MGTMETTLGVASALQAHKLDKVSFQVTDNGEYYTGFSTVTRIKTTT